MRRRLPVLAALDPERVIFCRDPVSPVEAEFTAMALPVVRPSAFIVKSPVVVVAALAVRSRSFPVVVITEVSEMEARVGVIAPFPLIWNKVPEAAPAVVLVMAPVELILTKPVVAFIVAAPVGPSMFKAPPVVRTAAPLTLMV